MRIQELSVRAVFLVVFWECAVFTRLYADLLSFRDVRCKTRVIITEVVIFEEFPVSLLRNGSSSVEPFDSLIHLIPSSQRPMPSQCRGSTTHLVKLVLE